MAASKSLFMVQMINEAVLSVYGVAKERDMQEALLAIRSMMFDLEGTLEFNLNAKRIDDIKDLNK